MLALQRKSFRRSRILSFAGCTAGVQERSQEERANALAVPRLTPGPLVEKLRVQYSKRQLRPSHNILRPSTQFHAHLLPHQILMRVFLELGPASEIIAAYSQ